MDPRDYRSSDELGKAPLSKLLLRFSIPAIFALIVNALYNLVDRLYLSHYTPVIPGCSQAELDQMTNAMMSGLGFAMPLMEFIAVLGVLIGAGSTSLLSITLGAKDDESAEKIVGQCVAMEILVFVFLPIIAFFLMKPLLRHLGAQGQTLEFACSYLTVILIGSLFMHLSYGLGGLIRAEGKATMAMITMVVGAVSNVLLDPIFIFGKCGLPALGVKGAAWATNLAMLLSTAVGLAFLTSKKSPVRLKWKRIAIYRGLMSRVLSIGMMPGVMQCVGGFISVAYIRGYKIWGGEDVDILVSAIVIIQCVHTFVLQPAQGIAQAAQPIIGYSYGAGKYARMMKCTMKAARYATTLSTIFFFVMMLGAPIFTRAFISAPEEETVIETAVSKTTDDVAITTESATHCAGIQSENVAKKAGKVDMADPLTRKKLYDTTVWGMRVLALAFPFLAIPTILSTFFQSIGHAKTALVINLIRYVGILLPLIILLPYLFHGVDGVWYSQPISDFISGIGCGCILLYERQKVHGKMLARWHAHTPLPAPSKP